MSCPCSLLALPSSGRCVWCDPAVTWLEASFEQRLALTPPPPPALSRPPFAWIRRRINR